MKSKVIVRNKYAVIIPKMLEFYNEVSVFLLFQFVAIQKFCQHKLIIFCTMIPNMCFGGRVAPKKCSSKPERLCMVHTFTKLPKGLSRNF